MAKPRILRTLNRHSLPWLLLAVLMSFPAHAQPDVPDYPVELLAVSADGTRLAVSGRITYSDDNATSYVDVYALPSFDLVTTVDFEGQSRLMGLSYDGRRLIYSVPYSDLTIVDLETDERTYLLHGAVPVSVSALRWNPVDDRVAWTGGAVVSIYDVEIRQEVGYVADQQSPGLVKAIDWTDDGQRMATSTAPNDGSRRYNIQIWDAIPTVATANQEPTLRFRGGGSLDLRWDPTGRFVATNDQLDSVSIYHIETGELFQTLSAPFGAYEIAWSPDGQQLAGGGYGTLWVWDIETGALVQETDIPDLADALVWTSLGIIHNGAETGLYVNDVPMETHLASEPEPSGPGT